jgi:hypothetical protein
LSRQRQDGSTALAPFYHLICCSTAEKWPYAEADKAGNATAPEERMSVEASLLLYFQGSNPLLSSIP